MSETEADEFFDAVETLDPDDQSNEPVKKGSSPTPASAAEQASSPVDPIPVEERWSIMMVRVFMFQSLHSRFRKILCKL